ncbi:hypothetical protein ACFS5J_12320, partial [Flavobacterium chuncheonense]
MEKTIFRIKCVQEYCCTFLIKHFTHLVLVLFLFSQQFVSAQLVAGAAVKANFGVEADAYANHQQVTPVGDDDPSIQSYVGVDDWFERKSTTPSNQFTFPLSGLLTEIGPWDGAGFGVINQSAGTPTGNVAFERRLSVTTPTFPYPYPIVNGYLWIDGVYGRDTYSGQGNNDATIFAGTSDKNSDNPSTWSLGSGSIPQKVDIIDVYAHLRGEGPKLPDMTDPRPFNTLWAFAAASLRETSGSKHIDFEYFRDKVEVQGNAFINTGNDGGRTAFTFDSDGNVVTPGTIIISIDYENGGTRPDVRIRVWMEQSTFNNLVAAELGGTMPDRPFNVIPGSFVTGEQSGNFGYARIISTTPLGGNPFIWGRVNTEGNTLGPPWGTRAGENALLSPFYLQYQLVEIGINLTAFGLDKRSTTNPCSNILGSLVVKTRSSAGGQGDSFTSEQKDFAGPYIFGTAIDPELNLNKDGDLTCLDPDAIITASVGPDDDASAFEFNFYGPDPDINDNSNNNPVLDYGPLLPGVGLTRPVTVGGTYTVIITSPAFPGCQRIAQVIVNQETPNDITVNCPPPVSENVCFYADQDAVDAAFDAWRDSFSVSGGAGLVQSPTQAELDALVAPDICGGTVTVNLSASDDCNPEGVSCSSTFQVTPDNEAPEIVDVSDYQLDNCNDDWPAFITTDWTDNCSAGGVGIQSDGGVDDGASADGCIQYRLYTFTITDDCGNSDTETTRVSREYDMTAPEIVDVPDYQLANCNDDWPAFITTDWTDNCSAGGLGIQSDGGVDDGASADGCIQYR